MPQGSKSKTTTPDKSDFSDAESQRVLTLAACAVARELGRQAAREYVAESSSVQKAREETAATAIRARPQERRYTALGT